MIFFSSRRRHTRCSRDWSSDVCSSDLSVPVEAIARAVDDRTALVATSHVYFTSGAIQDIKRVADAARRCGALTLVDAYQSVGQVPVDVKAAGVDFLTAGGGEWVVRGAGGGAR